MLSFDHVHLRYDAKAEVLNDVTLSLKEGSFHFLTGPSGAGKSSLLRLALRAERASEGTVALFGRDLAALAPAEMAKMRRRVGIVFQDFRLLPHLTALENAALPLRLVGAREREVRSHVRDLLGWVGLGDRQNAMPCELSGGEQQRVAIARAVVAKPKLLLADEPTGNIDEQSARKILKLFVELNKMGTAVLLATHQHELVETLGFPVLRLNKGRLVLPRKKVA